MKWLDSIAFGIMSCMPIEYAGISDLERILAIYQRCKTRLEAEGIKQWYEGYPNITVLRGDVDSGELFKYVVDGRIVAVLVLTEKQEKEYETVKWQQPEAKSLVVKRLAVEPDFQNRGIATELMKFAEDYAAGNGYTAIRLDAYSGNEAALNFYIDRDYHEVGEVFFPKRQLPFKCFEKELRS
jgi:ribosomal protein S18 acetylase RimI-like enzyme